MEATGAQQFAQRFDGAARFDGARDLAFSPDGARLFVTGNSDNVDFLDVATVAYAVRGARGGRP